MYYYFVNNDILKFDWIVDVTLNPAYEPLTNEQIEFYQQHPTASVWEVRRCELNPEPTLEQIKESAKQTLSDLSLETMSKFIKSYQLSNAQSSITLYQIGDIGSMIYDIDRASSIVHNYNRIGSQLRGYYKTAESLINEAEDKNTVLSIESEYIDIYNHYE